MQDPILGQGPNGPIRIDLDRLIETRLLLQANSGGGKSWAIRRLLEQTHGRVQQLVLDVEDEFHTLREKYDYVLAGRDGGDCPAHPKAARRLAAKLLELGVSAIVGIYELKARERVEFVRDFLDALVNAPRALWHPVLVVVDEAHLFCPQQGEAASATAVIDLMTRGRKRGFCGVLATQRISKLHKDAAAEANNKLIGRSALDVDLKRAADELGLSGRDESQRLRRLKPGEFYAFGPALADQVEWLQVGPVQTTHPRAGQRAAAPAPPRAAVRKVLAALADLPAEAEREERSVAELERQIAELRQQLRTARAGGVSEQDLERARTEGARAAERRLAEMVARWSGKLVHGAGHLEGALAALGKVGDLLREPIDVELATSPLTRESRPASARRSSGARTAVVDRARTEPAAGLDGPEQRILDALAWLEAVGVSPANESAAAFLAGYRVGGGAWNNPRGRLRQKGLIQYTRGAEMLALTEQGRALARFPERPGTTEELQATVLGRLDGPERRLLEPLLAAYPGAMSHEELATAARYEAGGGAFNNPRGRLRSLGLVEYPERGTVRASDVLFLQTR